MRRVLNITLAAAALGLAVGATPANATPTPAPTPATDPCSYTFLTGSVACVGYVGGNLLTGTTGSATTSTELTYINQLLNGPATTSGAGYTPPYLGVADSTVLGALSNLNGSATLNFGSLVLSGWTVVGAHFGNNIDSDPNNVTAFWLINLTTPTSTLTLQNGQGSSNAQVFATGGSPTPEPATWAMMLLGFGGIGMALRRRKRRSSQKLLQIA